MPIKIIGAPIARDKYGLALSSRNKYFDAEGLALARQLNVIMKNCAKAISAGEKLKMHTHNCEKALLKAGFDSVDYVSVANSKTLEIIKGPKANVPSRLLIAAHCRGVRLIDNCAIRAVKD